jgi:hypothetical protein
MVVSIAPITPLLISCTLLGMAVSFKILMIMIVNETVSAKVK